MRYFIALLLVVVTSMNCEFFTEPESNPPNYYLEEIEIEFKDTLIYNFSEAFDHYFSNPIYSLVDSGSTNIVELYSFTDSILTVISKAMGESTIRLNVIDEECLSELFLKIIPKGIYLKMGEELVYDLSELIPQDLTYDSLSIQLDTLETILDTSYYFSNSLFLFGGVPGVSLADFIFFENKMAIDTLPIPIITTIRKVVLGEMFTNDNCAGCVEGNHKVDEIIENNEESVAIIRYHLNWPDPNDPMYLYNVAENEARMYFYQDFFTDDGWALPNFVVGGIENPVSVDTDWEFSMQSQISGNTSFYLGHQTESEEDSIAVKIQIYSEEQIEDVYDCYAVVVENNYEYSGGNGEDIHHQVMRDIEVLENISINGEEEIFIYLLQPPGYSVDNSNFHIVTFLQNSENKEIVQSNIDHPIIDF